MKPIYLKYLKEINPFFLSEKKLQTNPIIATTTPFVLVPNESSGDSVLPVSANSSLSWDMSNDQSGLLAIRRLSMTATSDNFLIEIEEAKRSAKMSNNPIHAKTILGSQGKEFKLPYPIILPKLQNLRLVLSDLSGADNTIRLAFAGYKCFSSEEDIFRDENPIHDHIKPYFYTTNSDVSLLASASGIAYISINSGDFLCYGLTVYSTGAFKYKIFDVNLGRAWQNGYITSYQMGDAQAQEQSQFDFPILLKKNSQLKIEVSNLTAAVNQIYLTLYGISFVE